MWLTKDGTVKLTNRQVADDSNQVMRRGRTDTGWTMARNRDGDRWTYRRQGVELVVEWDGTPGIDG